MGGGQVYYEGVLVILPGKIEFRPTYKANFDGAAKFFNITPEGNSSITCAQVSGALPDGVFICEIDCSPSGKNKCRFKAETEATAANALAAIREACNPSAQTKPTAQAGVDTLEGTTWRGASSGGDKQYELQFLPNGEVVFHLKLSQSFTNRGTWRRTGNTIQMDFRNWKQDANGYPFNELLEATIGVDGITGSWAEGKYNYTVAKAP